MRVKVNFVDKKYYHQYKLRGGMVLTVDLETPERGKIRHNDMLIPVVFSKGRWASKKMSGALFATYDEIE
ncbi:hypothetical protein HOU22_gp02 [Escherichia phage C130_2]|uniref:Uncharacterized protein n=1 Tax=Escherichia phage C130_2 TaxID=2234093 RepID=A0A384ZRP4_9CAUD|nr:hypothetical protein HOU22_gp02 [Escherichia phage C130_2]AXC34320.1 hypothetical protein 1302_0010 [Escherichia phage C130_2]